MDATPTSESIMPHTILGYWYSERIKSKWFNSTKELDEEIKNKFEAVWKNAIRGEYKHWCDQAEGCLALAIIFDQLPLNMFRGEMESFSTEAMAIKIAKEAVNKGFDKVLSKEQVIFLYMPLMHSENIEDQNLSVKLFEEAGLTENARFARHHRDIVQRFGRFPHRNAILQRESSQAETDYLTSKEAFKG